MWCVRPRPTRKPTPRLICVAAPLHLAWKSIWAKPPGAIKKSIQAVADYFKTAPQSMATFASNHDIFAGVRLWDQVQGNAAQYKLAAASYLLLPGTPFIYYGEEIGMAGLQRHGGRSAHSRAHELDGRRTRCRLHHRHTFSCDCPQC